MSPSVIAIILSTVSMGESPNPLAEARITFENTESNSARDEQDYAVEWNGLPIMFRFNFNVDPIGSDQIVVTPPIGWTCEPADCTLTQPEGTVGVLDLFAFQGS